MLDQVLGLLLFGLGLGKAPSQPSVKGDNTEIRVEEDSSGHRDDNKSVTPTSETLTEKERMIQDAKHGLTGSLTKPAPKFVPLIKKVLDDKHEANIKKRELELETVFAARESRVTDELKTRRREAEEKFKGERQTFERKITELKDVKKKTAVSRIDAKVSEINTKRTDDMTVRLTHMSEILDKIGVRASEAKTAGKNISTVDSLVTSARASVTSAQTVVNTQASKQYIAEIQTDDTVGQAMTTTLSSVQTDMKTMFESVRVAHQAVQKAVNELGVILGKVDQTEAQGGTQ